ncbi:MAG: hypothetical protein QNJ32_18635 [Xenococcaceae cyanobacterium MO_167.B27]|nr:hypothetical protein [Xenococcaceae cyanobacterium MO_167.B27]
MSIKATITSISIASLSWCLTSSPALAAYFTPLTNYDESDWDNAMNSSFREEISISSYLNDTGMTSQGLGLMNQQATEEQFLWESGKEVNFELSLKDGVLTQVVDGRVISSQDISGSGFNGMMLTANSTEGNSVELTKLRFSDGSRLRDGLVSEDGNTDYLKITGINEDFTLRGTQVYTWDESEPLPTDIALGYEIKLGNFYIEESEPIAVINPIVESEPIAQSDSTRQEIPEPTTVSFFSLIAIALGMKARKK